MRSFHSKEDMSDQLLVIHMIHVSLVFDSKERPLGRRKDTCCDEIARSHVCFIFDFIKVSGVLWLNE